MATFFLVDDQPHLHELYRNILESEGHIVVGDAFNGIDCLEKIKQLEQLPDYILMDHRMPEMDGITTTKKLLEEFPGLMIIFVSADVSIRNDALNVGALAFLQKPFTLDIFFDLIEKNKKE